MSAPYPGTDSRRKQDLLLQLETAAQRFLPAWRGLTEPDDPGRALLQIGADLAEHVTSRLDRTGERDLKAFLNWLDQAGPSPRSAEAWLVLTLSDKLEDPVWVRERVQIGAPGPDGEEIVFETPDDLDLTLTPARLQGTFSVDPSTDRIETAPPGFGSLEPPRTSDPPFALLSFAGEASTRVQITPPIGLEKGDWIRIGGAAYKIADEKDGIYTIEPGLDAPAAAGAEVARITRFTPGLMRDLQRHVLYVGHKELFNLEQAAVITLHFVPGDIGDFLSGHEIAWELWGTPDETEETGWQPVEVAVGTSSVSLRKSWIGKVDEVEVAGEKSRWLRARLLTPMTEGPVTFPRDRIELTVRSEDAADVQASISGDTQESTGPSTVTAAFHNATPLPVSDRFLPFGPEPRLFDQFYLAAPEVLSKKGASATLRIDVGDATIKSAIATGATDVPPANFAVSSNGHLQLIRPTPTGINRWLDLGYPGAASREGAEAGLTAKAVLDPARQPAVIPFSEDEEERRRCLVSALADGFVWTTLVTFIDDGSRTSTVPWTRAVDAPLPTEHQDMVLLPKAGSDSTTIGGRLFSVGDAGLRWVGVSLNGSIDADDWSDVANGSGSPKWGREVRLSPVQTTAWPVPPVQDAYELLLLDQRGEPWLGRVENDVVDWRSLAALGDENSLSVRPTALRLDDDILYALTATSDGALDLRELDDDTVTSVGRSEPLEILEGSVISAAIEETSGQIVSVVVTGPAGRPSAAVLYGTSIIEFVSSSDKAPGTTTTAAWLNREEAGELSLFVSGTRETTCVRRPIFSPPIEIEALEDALLLEKGERPAHYALLSQSDGDQVVKLSKAVIEEVPDTQERLYGIDQSHGLREGDTYRFFRRVPSSPDEFVGQFESSTPDRLTLHADHIEIADDQVVIIDDVMHDIVSIDNTVEPIVVTVTPGIDHAAGSLTYVAAEAIGGDRLAASRDIGAVGVFEESTATPGSGDLMLMPAGSDPAVRLVIDHSGGGIGPSRVYLADGWSNPPAVPFEALLQKSSTLADWQAIPFARDYQNPELSWEYFDGRGWRRLEDDFSDTTGHLVVGGDVTFDVPDDLAETRVGGKDDYWIRARLIGGDYGQPTFVVDATPVDVKPPDADDAVDLKNLLFDQKITVDRSALNPPEILSIAASFELDDRVDPELTLVDNNLAQINQTAAAEADGAVFDLFAAAASIDRAQPKRALYLGLSKAFSANALRLLVDAAEQEGDVPLVWEVLAEGQWREVQADDDDPTKGLLRPGIVTLRIDVRPTRQPLFGQALFWLRAYPGDETSWAPDLAGIYLNAAPAEQAKTLRNELLGSSIGEPDARFRLAEKPVLPGSLELRVRERPGSEERADLIATFGEKAIVSDDPDRPGDWVLWREVPSLIDQAPDARVYTLDARTGSVRFGGGRQGRILPAGTDNLRAFKYRAGGGQAGNVAAFTIASPKSAVSGVEAVTNPLPSRGGSDGRSDDVSCDQAAATVRHVNRAIAPRDIEALALDFAPEIVRARCLRPEALGSRMRVAIVVSSDNRSVEPSVAMRDGLADFLKERASSAWPEASFDVTGPDQVPLTIEIVLTPASESPPTLPLALKDRLFAWLHPTTGGHSGRGRPFGRGVWPSDVHQALADDLGGAGIRTLELARKDGRGVPAAIGPTSIVTIARDDIVVRFARAGS